MSEESKKSGLRNNIIFVAAVLGVLGLLYAISGERSNRIPDDSTHIVDMKPADCLQCHGPGMVRPRTEKHPPKDDCMKCHKRKKGVKPLKASDAAKPAKEFKMVKETANSNSTVSNSTSPDPQK